MTLLRRTPALLLAALLAFGLTSVPEPAPAADPTVTLTDAGNGKKKALRFTPKKGLKESMTMAIDMSMEMSMGGQEMPAQDLPVMTMVMDTEINDVNKEDGTFTYTFKFTKMDVGASDTLPPAAIEQMKAKLGEMVGMEGHATMTARGFSRDGDFVLPEGAGKDLQETLDSMTQSMDQMVAPLPEEPVGVGAKWTVVSKVSSNGMQIDQTANYEFVSLIDGVLELKVGIVQAAPVQTVDLGAQGSFELVRYTGSGDGTTSLNLTQIMPVEAVVDVQNDAGMKMDMNGTPMEMGVKSKVKNTMTGSIRK